MSDTLTVYVNCKKYSIPQNIERLDEFLEEIGFTGREYTVRRLDGHTPVKIDGPMFIFDDGDEFMITPRYVTDA